MPTLKDIGVGDELGGGRIIFVDEYYAKGKGKQKVIVTYLKTRKKKYFIYVTHNYNNTNGIYMGNSYKAALKKCWNLLKGSISLIHHKK